MWPSAVSSNSSASPAANEAPNVLTGSQLELSSVSSSSSEASSKRERLVVARPMTTRDPKTKKF